MSKATALLVIETMKAIVNMPGDTLLQLSKQQVTEVLAYITLLEKKDTAELAESECDVMCGLTGGCKFDQDRTVCLYGSEL